MRVRHGVVPSEDGLSTKRALAARPSTVARAAVRRALERGYPLAKQLAEVLELEAVEPEATAAKSLRRRIGARLAELGRVP